VSTLDQPRRAFLRRLGRAAPGAVRALSRELSMPKKAAAEALAAAAGLGLAGLSRHQKKRPQDSRAAVAVVKKYGRPADLAAPDLGISAHLSRPEISPRLGGLLGDAGPRAATWLAERTGTTPDAAGRALAAATPLVLGALGDAVEPATLTEWLARVPDSPLDDPGALLAANGDPSDAFRRLRRFGAPWWMRTLGLSG
jgi:uncharacterized protein DUF937